MTYTSCSQLHLMIHLQRSYTLMSIEFSTRALKRRRRQQQQNWCLELLRHHVATGMGVVQVMLVLFHLDQVDLYLRKKLHHPFTLTLINVP